MSFLKIPVRPDFPSYDFQIQLDSKIYGLAFSWNDRIQLWMMNIFDENGVEILTGVQMLTNWDMVGRFRIKNLPPKKFLCIDTSGEGKNPGIDDFGGRVILVYGDDA